MLPAGYTIGGLLILNLLANFVTRFRLQVKHAGILCVHSGLILLLLGEVLTDVFSVESQLRLEEGAEKNYTESIFNYELAVSRPIPAGRRVVAFPQVSLAAGADLSHSELPVRIRVLQYWPNSMLRRQSVTAPAVADSGLGAGLSVVALPRTGKMDERNVPSALVELFSGAEVLGTYLLSGHLAELELIQLSDGAQLQASLRPVRYYMQSSIRLNDFIREVYPGTNKPSHFESQITLAGGDLPAPRSARIYMNHPLRFEGRTYYQASFAGNDDVSILQVVKNPSWLLPYFACGLVTLGLLWQSLSRFRASKGAVS
jgi:hypothetical protein